MVEAPQIPVVADAPHRHRRTPVRTGISNGVDVPGNIPVNHHGLAEEPRGVGRVAQLIKIITFLPVELFAECDGVPGVLEGRLLLESRGAVRQDG